MNLDKLRQRTVKFMQLEELEVFHNKVRIFDEGVGNRSTNKESTKPPLPNRRLRDLPRPQHFTKYTSLNTN